MSNGTLAGRYAKALFDAAEEQQITADIAEQVNMLSGQLESDPDFCQLITGRSVRPAAKKELIEKVYGQILHPFMRNFLYILFDKNRENTVEEALKAFNELYKAKLGIVTAKLTTAKPIAQDDADRLAASVKTILNKDIEFRTNVDPAILGGAIISVGDLLIDGSLKSNFRHMRDELMK